MFPLEPAVIFEIPKSDLSLFTVAALTNMSSQATTEYNTLRESVFADESLQTDDNIGTLEALKAFTAAADAEIKSRGKNANRLSSLPVLAEPVPVETAEIAELATEAPEEFSAPTIAQLAPHVPALEGEIATEKPVYGRMFAAANVDNFVADSEIKDLKTLAKAFISKTASFASMAAMGAGGDGTPIHYQVAYLTRDYPAEFSVYDREEDDLVLAKVVDEFSRFGSGGLLAEVERNRQELAATNPLRDGLVAAVGWCAPSETLYDTCFQGVIDGLLDVPEVQARRGGIRHNQGIDFTGVFGGGTGFFNLTEAQVISGTTKTCIEIQCPEFVDDRLGVTGLCITGNILQNRGYPEFVALWMRAAMVASAHQINSLQIAAVVAGSTAVDLSASPAFASDGSVASQVMAAIELAIVDMKYRLRMSRAATLEVVLPWWLLAQFRADFSRRNGGDYLDNMNLTDSQIVSWFSTRGARAQWVLDWQDAFAPTDLVGAPVEGGPGAATAISAFPTGVKFLVYPAGTWVRAVSDVITLSAIYDSTKLVTNQLTQLFAETGWKMMRMCPLSRVYTVPICPSGNTGAQREVTCATVG
jgi:hypothetical protein